MKSFNFLENELWWGGEVGSWEKMPISADDEISFDFSLCGHSQTAPLFSSNKGRVIFSKSAFKISFANGKINLDCNSNPELLSVGKNLKDAYNYASTKLYNFEKKNLDQIYFNAPQYNIWVQMGYM